MKRIVLWIFLFIINPIGLLLYFILPIIAFPFGKFHKALCFMSEDYWELPEKITNKLFKLNLTKMKTKYLGQALKFACLPTLSVLVLLFCGFFSISKTVDFISSDMTGAVILRLGLVIAEIVLVIVMYLHYEKEDIIANPQTSNLIKQDIYRNTSIYELKSDWSEGRNTYNIYSTSNPRIVVVERLAEKL